MDVRDLDKVVMFSEKAECLLCAPYIAISRYIAHSICAALPYTNQYCLPLQMFATFPSPKAKPQVCVACTSQCYVVHVHTCMYTLTHKYTHTHAWSDVWRSTTQLQNVNELPWPKDQISSVILRKCKNTDCANTCCVGPDIA